jgi:glyoxylase-like metal-dependent hydrolase (beta-lactamase superfamily II)
VELTFLDARQGDAIWVRWGQGRQLLVDMGTSGTGRALADRFRALPEDQRAFELLVVTHVDTDHIGGVLTGLVDPDEPVPVTFADVWFNGWEHLNGLVPADERSELEPMGGVQGELLTTWLRDHAWNDAFGRAAVIRTDTTLPRVELPDGLTITVLAPVLQRLTDLVPEWQLAVAAALEKGTLTDVSPGLEPMGPSTAPTL